MSPAEGSGARARHRRTGFVGTTDLPVPTLAATRGDFVTVENRLPAPGNSGGVVANHALVLT